MMMNSCEEEMKRNVVVSDSRDAVISPQPQHPSRPRSLRSQLTPLMEFENEILDIMARKNCGETDPTMALTSRVSNPFFTGSPPSRVSNPFFTGSPPCRVSNPLTKDPLFRERLNVVTPSTPPTRVTKPQPPSSPRNGGCVRAAATNFGNNPAVRVVGFDCDRRRNNRSISTLA